MWTYCKCSSCYLKTLQHQLHRRRRWTPFHTLHLPARAQQLRRPARTIRSDHESICRRRLNLAKFKVKFKLINRFLAAAMKSNRKKSFTKKIIKLITRSLRNVLKLRLLFVHPSALFSKSTVKYFGYTWKAMNKQTTNAYSNEKILLQNYGKKKPKLDGLR